MSAQISPESRPTLVIVCGLAATGKSTLAVRLAEALGWAMFSKDDFKELLWDAMPSDSEQPNRATSRAIGGQGIATLFFVTRRLLESEVSCVIESNFLPQFAHQDLEPFTKLANVRQVHCTLPAADVLRRYTSRYEAGGRHPIHADAAALSDLAVNIEHGAGDPLPLSAPLLQVDTTDGYVPSFERIVDFCRS